MARRILNRKDLRADYEAAERRKGGGPPIAVASDDFVPDGASQGELAFPRLWPFFGTFQNALLQRGHWRTSSVRGTHS